MRRVIAVLWCVVALGLVDRTILARERHLRDGRTIFLELAPIDPRSLMQGDYMALRFWTAPISAATADGHAVAAVDERSVARIVRQDDATPLAPGEIRLRYRVRGEETRFATNAYFFQEGDAALYERARYGEFRVDGDGELLLVGLRGPELDPLGPGHEAPAS